MRQVFKGQLPLDKEAKEDLAKRSTIVLDTNVLLDLYRYSDETADYFLRLLDSVKNRLWLPHHVGWEFFRRRSTVRASLTEHHDERLVALSSLSKVINKTKGKKTHVGDDTDEAAFVGALQSYTAKLKTQKRRLMDWSASTEDDHILESIMDLYDDRTASRPSKEWFALREEEGQERSEKQIPPGYEDRDKVSNRYGDYFIWKECIEQSLESGSPLIFVTRDSKNDWWEKVGNTVVGPHAELLDEFWESTGQRLTLLNPTQLFDELLPDFVGGEVPEVATQAREEIQVAQEAKTDADTVAKNYVGLLRDITSVDRSWVDTAAIAKNIDFSHLIKVDWNSVLPPVDYSWILKTIVDRPASEGYRDFLESRDWNAENHGEDAMEDTEADDEEKNQDNQ